ncbi:MAG: DoxX family protein [Armatimonadetes bacterium]|nr:DoxX family protein [Armatimonadota bacterium]MDW8027856.1 DoxX family protein [Armatimonadota bacterium]
MEQLFSSLVPVFSVRLTLGLTIVRILSGLAFVHHGWGKIQNPFGWMGPEAPVPGIFQALAAISEFFGGLGWIFGFLTPLASFGILATMTVAVGFHLSRGDPFVGLPGQPSYELAAVYWTIALLLLIAGPGQFSLDSLIIQRLKKKGNQV